MLISRIRYLQCVHIIINDGQERGKSVQNRWVWWVTGVVMFSFVAAGCGNSSAPAPSPSVKKNASKTRSTKKVWLGNSSSKTPPLGSTAAGSKFFASTCQTCHGKGGAGTGMAPRLAKPSTVVARFGSPAALESFIAHNMPADNPGSLSSSQVANVSAYVWHIAGGK